MLIGLSGKQGTGKTTLAQLAEDEYGFTRVSFAGILKLDLITYLKSNGCVFDASNFFGDSTKKNKLIGVPNCTTDIPIGLLTFHPVANMMCLTYRAAMQWYGDMKRASNKDYWLQRFMESTDFSTDVIVDDVRYRNEAALIHALGGILIRINWPAKSVSDAHASETQLDNFPLFDGTINKEHSISLEEYHLACTEHMNLWLGHMDDTSDFNNASMSFKSTSLTTIWKANEATRNS